MRADIGASEREAAADVPVQLMQALLTNDCRALQRGVPSDAGHSFILKLP